MTMVTKQEGPPKERLVSDLQLASFFLSLDYLIVRLTESSTGRVEFVFADVPEEVVFRFYQGGCNANARKLLDAYRALKGILIQQDGGGRR